MKSLKNKHINHLFQTMRWGISYLETSNPRELEKGGIFRTLRKVLNEIYARYCDAKCNFENEMKLE